jgi:hypothetical protein
LDNIDNSSHCWFGYGLLVVGELTAEDEVCSINIDFVLFFKRTSEAAVLKVRIRSATGDVPKPPSSRSSTPPTLGPRVSFEPVLLDCFPALERLEDGAVSNNDIASFKGPLAASRRDVNWLLELSNFARIFRTELSLSRGGEGGSNISRRLFTLEVSSSALWVF